MNVIACQAGNTTVPLQPTCTKSPIFRRLCNRNIIFTMKLTRSLLSLKNSRGIISRTFTSSKVACKGKRRSLAAQVLDEDDFAFDGSLKEDEDLFGSSPTSETALEATQNNSHQDMRVELFNALHVSSLAILNLGRQMSQPPRKSTVVRLISLAKGKEDLRKILDVIAAFRNISRPPDLKTCDDFLGRCITLGHPEIALEALQKRSKYGVDIPSLVTARRLLHALSRPSSKITHQILSDTLQFAELYPTYGLPPASTDVFSCATVASAISRFVLESPEQEDPQTNLINTDAVTSAWKDILLDLKKTSGKQMVEHETVEAKTLHRLKGRVSEIRTAIRKSEKRSELWLKRLESKVNHRLNTVALDA